MVIRIARAIQTTDCLPVQWDAWTGTGQYLYLRYRSGVGSITAYPSPDWTAWDPDTAPLVQWDDDSGDNEISLDDFLIASGAELTPGRFVLADHAG